MKLWLYPNVLAERPPRSNDVRFHWLYPGGFSPAGIELSNLRIDGAPTPVAIHDIPFVGRRALARAALAAPLAPGQAVTVDVDFVTQVPRRYGAFGCDGVRCRLMGGFYPMPARDDGPTLRAARKSRRSRAPGVRASACGCRRAGPGAGRAADRQ